MFLRKLMLAFGAVPASIRRISEKVLQVTTKLLWLAESKGAIIVTQVIPGDKDEALRLALIVALNALKERLEGAATSRERKRVAKEIATRMIAHIDEHRLESEKYGELFEKVFEDNKQVLA